MKKINFYILALVAVLGFSVAACSDDDDVAPAKAVLATTSTLQFDVTDTQPRVITVYSDGQWTCEHADWVTVVPETGSGTTEVTISVSENLRGGLPDNPRKNDVIFKGVTKASEAHLMVRQDGDKFREIAPITIADMDAQEDEDVAIVQNVTVTTVLDGGFVVTDGVKVLKVKSATAPEKGQAVTLYGERASDDRNMTIMALDEFVVEGSTSVLPTPVDITAVLDSFDVKTRDYVTLTGVVENKNITVKDAKLSGFALEVDVDIDWDAFNGHRVKVYAFNAGTASPIVNLIVNKVEDLGLVNAIFFSEDFEWLAPWAAAGNAGATVETDDPGQTSPNLTASSDGVSAYAALKKKGYTILATHADSKSERAPEKQTYLNANYMKFGLTGYYSGIVMPITYDVPADAAAELTFDWCSQRQGSGKWDPTQIVVIITTNGVETQYPVAAWALADGAAYFWKTETIQIPAGQLQKGSTLTIRNCDEQWPMVGSAPALRWFLDNVIIMGK